MKLYSAIIGVSHPCSRSKFNKFSNLTKLDLSLPDQVPLHQLKERQRHSLQPRLCPAQEANSKASTNMTPLPHDTGLAKQSDSTPLNPSEVGRCPAAPWKQPRINKQDGPKKMTGL